MLLEKRMTVDEGPQDGHVCSSGGPGQEPEKTVEEELAKETMSKHTLVNLAFLSEHMLYLVNAAVNDAVAAAPKEQPQFPSNLINVAVTFTLYPNEFM